MEQLKGNATVVDTSLRETKKHGTEGFPFAAYLDDFSYFQNGYICWHWHDEVQMTLILEGEFTCQVGNEKILMKPGDSIFINSCALHQIHPCKKSFGKLYSFIWQADMLAGNEGCDVYKNCIVNILEKERKYYFFEKDNEGGRQMKAALLRVMNLFTERKDFYELRIYHQLSKIWLDLCDCMNYMELHNSSVAGTQLKARDEERVKNALQYMQDKYNEDISLDDIAKAAMTSRSELCKSFRRALDTSPNEFLIEYRIRQSMLLLENQDLRIADIAEMTGFSSPSHFGSCFRKYVGCTPLQFRRNI